MEEVLGAHRRKTLGCLAGMRLERSRRVESGRRARGECLAERGRERRAGGEAVCGILGESPEEDLIHTRRQSGAAGRGRRHPLLGVAEHDRRRRAAGEGRCTGEQGSALVVDQDVGRLDVAVNQPARGRGIQRAGDLGGPAGDLLRRRRCGAGALGEVVTPDVVVGDPQTSVGSPRSCTLTTWGWLRPATTSASRSKRASALTSSPVPLVRGSD